MKTEEQRQRAEQTFQYFIREFREKIDAPSLEIRDLAMAIRGYGIFANVRRKCELDFCFSRVGRKENSERSFSGV